MQPTLLGRLDQGSSFMWLSVLVEQRYVLDLYELTFERRGELRAWLTIDLSTSRFKSSHVVESFMSRLINAGKAQALLWLNPS